MSTVSGLAWPVSVGVGYLSLHSHAAGIIAADVGGGGCGVGEPGG